MGIAYAYGIIKGDPVVATRAAKEQGIRIAALHRTDRGNTRITVSGEYYEPLRDWLATEESGAERPGPGTLLAVKAFNDRKARS